MESFYTVFHFYSSPAMYTIRPKFAHSYASFLQDIRHFFQEEGFLEVDTPLLNSYGSVEAYLDSFLVLQDSPAKSPYGIGREKEISYLITSPEYRLKALLSQLRCNIFQIAHCFRPGDIGDIHKEEFLMLEFYLLDADEFKLMELCERLLIFLYKRQAKPKKVRLRPPFSRRSMKNLLSRYAQCSWDRSELEERLRLIGIPEHGDLKDLSYSDLFFTAFLNLIDPNLSDSNPIFVYHYPPQLAAFSQIQNGYARRFELYWQGVELANGYYELRTKQEYLERFQQEQELRIELGKMPIAIDQDLIKSLERKDLPECSGLSLGIDRLFLIFTGEYNFESIWKECE